jgi:hypothetical protein
VYSWGEGGPEKRGCIIEAKSRVLEERTSYVTNHISTCFPKKQLATDRCTRWSRERTAHVAKSFVIEEGRTISVGRRFSFRRREFCGTGNVIFGSGSHQPISPIAFITYLQPRDLIYHDMVPIVSGPQDLPLELFDVFLTEAIRVRSLKRAFRLRLVNRRFALRMTTRNKTNHGANRFLFYSGDPCDQ